MDEQRRDSGGIVVGCFIVGLLFEIVIVAVAAVWLWSVPVRVQEQEAIRAEEQAIKGVESTTSADREEKLSLPSPETPQPDAK